MKPFLESLAQHLFQKYQHKLSDYHIVLPSRRACRYFREYLTKTYPQPLLAPSILSIEDFVVFLSDVKVLDKVSLLFQLYKTYRKFDKTPDHTLDKFAPLGTSILRDFNAVEMNLSYPRAIELFEYVEDAKAIERWGQELGKELSIPEKSVLSDYFSFWKYLTQTFITFRRELLNEKKAYHGLMYRYVYENISKLIKEKEVDFVIFAGFGQLSNVEIDLIGYLKREEKAEILWDSDEFYFTRFVHEGGSYLRKMAKRLQITPTDDEFGMLSKKIGTFSQKIEFIQTTTVVAQAKLAGTILENKLKENLTYNNQQKLENKINFLGILLPDEALLQPLLHSLPTQINVTQQDKQTDIQVANLLNITMGIQVQRSSIFTLIDLCFKLQESSKQSKDGFTSFYHKDLLKLLVHPFLLLTSQQRTVAHIIKEDVQKNNKVFIRQDTVWGLAQNDILLKALLHSWEGNFQNAIQLFFEVIRIIQSLLEDDKESAELEFLREIYQLLHLLRKVLSSQQEVISLKIFKQFLLELLRELSVPFTGEPIAPLQIMGMLESRTLDFEHLIILSCNEGNLPTAKRIDSLIPHDIRVMYGLPTHQDEDGAVAYTLFRLLQRAKNITFIYADPFANKEVKEKSRFLMQIEEEFKEFPLVQIEKKKLRVESSLSNLSKQPVKKDEAVMQKVKEALMRGRSPSAFVSYLKSPLNFFYEHVLKLQEEKEVEESFDQRTFGTLLHGTLEELLKRFIGKNISEDDVNKILDDESLILQTIQQVVDDPKEKNELKGMSLVDGRNYVLAQVCQRLIYRFLSMEKSQLPIRLVMMEKHLKNQIELHLSENETFTFGLVGIADRIDIVNNEKILRVVDYKTGRYDKNVLKANDRLEVLNDGEKGKIVQLLVYKYLLIQNILQKDKNSSFDESEKLTLPSNFKLEDYAITSGFYFFRNLSDGFVGYQLSDEPKDIQSFIHYVEDFFRTIVMDILDTSKDFTEEPSVFEKLVGE
jgi:hypothetical protein